MGVCEEDTGGGQSIQIRGLGLGVPAEATDPVVEVVDRDEQYVRAPSGLALNNQSPKQS